MPRKKIQEDKKKIKTGVTINSEVVELMDELLEDIGNTNRSRYIEKLIREDLEKRGKNIERDF
jgi:metal-responsive CopG/Arc/MetJ family transcriptional regulator